MPEVVGNSRFQFGHRHVGLVTACFNILSAEAIEVCVCGAVPVGRRADAEASAAAGTVQIAFERVWPFLALVFIQVAGGKDRLHHGESCFIDQWVVPTLVLNTIVSDHTGVVAVMEDAVNKLGLYRPFGQALGFRHAQAQVIKLVGQGAQGVEPGGIQRECLAHDRPHDLIDNHEADVFALAFVADVPVAEWCFAGRATDLHLFAQALAGFLAEVARVPLGNSGHNTVYQFAAGCFVDVFGGGYQPDAVLGQQHADLHVIFPVAGQAVELVNDDVVDVWVFSDALQHPAQFGPVGRAGTFAPVYVFVVFADTGTKFSGLALAVLSLRLNRVAVFIVAGVGLLARGDAVIGEGLSE